MKQRLDQAMMARSLVASRSQAESYIRLGKVTVNGRSQTKAGYLVDDNARIVLDAPQQYVSRAALKLASAAEIFKFNFKGKTVLDVGSSTGGFTQFALMNGAKKVVAVELGTDQMHASLRKDPRVALYEKTDIRTFTTSEKIDVVVADVSFISLREILPSVVSLCTPHTDIIAMVKPQFEAVQSDYKHKGVIKNDAVRRKVLKDFETWARDTFVTYKKADSLVAGSRGNVERFYWLRLLHSK